MFVRQAGKALPNGEAETKNRKHHLPNVHFTDLKDWFFKISAKDPCGLFGSHAVQTSAPPSTGECCFRVHFCWRFSTMLIRKLLLFRPVVGPFKGASSSRANDRGVFIRSRKVDRPSRGL